MLLFLDIDGVMVPAKSWKRPEFLNDGFPAFSGQATIALKQLVSVTDTVVLTTSHKGRFSLEEWKAIFNARGINIENIAALPTNVGNLTRLDEIVNWFTTNDVKDAFVIIDDDAGLNALPGFLKSNFIQTSPTIGLTLAHVQAVKALTNTKVATVA
jgi:hypothetical protein